MKGFDLRFVEAHRARMDAEKGDSLAPKRTRRAVEPQPAGTPRPGHEVRVLGVDTSLRCTGLAIVDEINGRQTLVDCRPIPCPAKLTLAECLVKIRDTLLAYLDEFAPDEVALEGIFFCKNARTSVILGHARGVVVETCARRALPLYEYPPSRVKRALTGSGSATKEQMQRMVQRIFSLPDLPQEDSADAVGMAVTHLHARKLKPLR